MKKILITTLIIGLLLSLAACNKDKENNTSEEKTISFKQDVLPILKTNCYQCHISPDGKGYQASGLEMSTYENLMKGTQFGPVIKPGDSLSSTLNMLVEGRADPSIKMPHGSTEGLPETDIQTLKLWVDQGAKNN